MDDLKDNLRTALDEARILVLCLQVLVGFEFDGVFQKNFGRLPELSQDLQMVALLLLLVALGFTMAPAAYHQIVEHGEENPRCIGFVTAMVGIALLPFAVGFGLVIYIAAQQVAGTLPGIVAGGIGALFALFLWYGLGLWHRLSPRAEQDDDQDRSAEGAGGSSMQSNNKPTPLKDKIQFALTETRVVLPGAQALLGFQTIIILTEAFDKMSGAMKLLHLASLFAVAISMILLIAPAAFHRVAERGRNTESVHKFAGVMVLSAMFFLALGIAGDLYVVVLQVTGSGLFALLSALFALLFSYGLWFGYSLFKRGDPNESEQEGQQPQPADRPSGA